jgi:hypothetical protein
MAITSEKEKLLGLSINDAMKPRKAFVEGNCDSLPTLCDHKLIAIK